MKAKFRINLTKPITGQEIADAAKKVAGDEYHQELAFVDDDGEVFQIGQNSSYPYKDLVIGVGPDAKPEVAMGAEYTEAYVLSWEHSGEKYAIVYSNDDIVNAVRSFRDEIQAAL